VPGRAIVVKTWRSLAPNCRATRSLAGGHVDDDREDGHQEHDRDFRGLPDAEPDDQQRGERDPRRRVEKRHERPERPRQAAVPADEQAGRQSDDRGQQQAEEHLGAAGAQVGPDLAGAEELLERVGHVERAGQDHLGLDAQRGDDLPGREHDDDRGRPVQDLAGAIAPALPGRGDRGGFPGRERGHRGTSDA
jgi:hypothetical protein